MILTKNYTNIELSIKFLKTVIRNTLIIYISQANIVSSSIKNYIKTI